MTQIHGTRLTGGHTLVDQFGTLEDHMAAHLLLSHRLHLHGLHEIVTEPLVEFPLYLPYLRLRLLRKRRCEIPPYHLHPITYQAIEHQADEIAQQVMYPEWQQREQIPEGRHETIDHLILHISS